MTEGIKLSCVCGWKPQPGQIVEIECGIENDNPILYKCPCGKYLLVEDISPEKDRMKDLEARIDRLEKNVYPHRTDDNPLGFSPLQTMETSRLTRRVDKLEKSLINHVNRFHQI